MTIKDLKEDVKLLFDIEKQTKKMYNDANKLRKQAASMTGDSSVFTCSHTFRDGYLCTYIRAYDGAVEEMQFEEFKNLINPNVFKNGVLVMSKLDRKVRLDSGNTSYNSSGPLNSTELDENSALNHSNEINIIDYGINVVDINNVFCGNCELFAKDSTAGGASTFHSVLGHLKKSFITLDELSPVASVQGRYLSSVYIQFLKLVKSRDAPAFVVWCEPKRPMNILSSILFPQCTDKGVSQIHIVTLFEDINKKMGMKGKDESLGQFSFYSVYDMFKSASDEKSNGETTLRIEFHWTGTEVKPMQQPPHSAKSVIQLQVTAGETRSAAHQVYLELRRLDSVTHAQADASTLLYNSNYSEQVLEDLKNFKTCVSDIQFYDHRNRHEAATSAASVDKKTDDIETPMSELLMGSFWHKDIDFTDKLWTFIQEADHLESIRFILDDVLTDIVNGSLQPAISPSNETKLAKYIRKLYLNAGDEEKADASEKIMELLGSEQSIVNLIKDIGFEKLRKDYFNFFLSHELTSSACLEKICRPSNVDISSLWKLHYCLEIVITPTIYLNLTTDYQCALLKAAIDFYSKNDVDVMSPKFCLSLLPFHESSSSIQSFCEDRQPVVWQHGVIRANKCGYDEAMVSRVETSLVTDGGEENVFHNIKEVKKYLREETLPLLNS